MSSVTYSAPRRRLAVMTLIHRGAIRITYAGDGTGGFVRNNDPASFAVVTKINDDAPNSYTRRWPDKPASYPTAARMINGTQNGKPFLYDEKYKQVIDSAKRVGLTDAQIFDGSTAIASALARIR